MDEVCVNGVMCVMSVCSRCFSLVSVDLAAGLVY